MLRLSQNDIVLMLYNYIILNFIFPLLNSLFFSKCYLFFLLLPYFLSPIAIIDLFFSDLLHVPFSLQLLDPSIQKYQHPLFQNLTWKMGWIRVKIGFGSNRLQVGRINKVISQLVFFNMQKN